MKAKIYRGTKEIGGTCIELTAQNGKKLWIDLGLPLDKTNPNVDYVKENKPDALLISHPHLDHYGLMEFVNQDTPVYIGSVSRELINAPRIFLDFPFIKKDFRIIEPWKPFVIADTFKITPHLVDHSSPEAFAFLIEADEKRIFYSGDFRATGRKKILFENLIKNPPSNIDLLLLEGTMIERENKGYKNEEEIEIALTGIFKNQKNISIVISSAQNIDRFVSVVNACKRTGKKVVIDIYNAWVLEKVKEKSPKLPTIEWKEVLVYKSKSQFEKISNDEYADFRNRISENSIENKVFTNPSNYVYFMRCPSEKFLEALKNKDKINLIYSQWDGYLKEEYKMYFTETINKIKANEIDFNYKPIHTSGHATIKDLLIFSHALKPQKIVPIHTQYPQKMKEEFENDGMKNVYLWDDNKEYEL